MTGGSCLCEYVAVALGGTMWCRARLWRCVDLCALQRSRPLWQDACACASTYLAWPMAWRRPSLRCPAAASAAAPALPPPPMQVSGSKDEMRQQLLRAAADAAVQGVELGEARRRATRLEAEVAALRQGMEALAAHDRHIKADQQVGLRQV